MNDRYTVESRKERVCIKQISFVPFSMAMPAFKMLLTDFGIMYGFFLYSTFYYSKPVLFIARNLLLDYLALCICLTS